MKVALGSDHAGYTAKQTIADELRAMGHEVNDFGVASGETADYPDIAVAVARSVASGDAQRGILVCGTGIGMSMAANKVRGIRAALCHDEFGAKMAREHNNANVLAMGERTTAVHAMIRILHEFMSTEFSGGRHGIRVCKIDAIDEDHGGC